MAHIFPKMIDRRSFIRRCLAVTASVAALPFVTACGSNPNQATTDSATVTPLSKEMNMNKQTLEFIHMATLAPNGHNTQPWKFSIQENVIRIFADAGRHLAVVDPDDREQSISLGCALENLVISAAAGGFASEIEAFPVGEAECLKVILHASDPAFADLAKAIPKRQSTRSLYDGKPIPTADLVTLQQLSYETGVSVRLYTAAETMEPLIESVTEGDRQQYQDKAFVAELITWLRFNEAEARKTMDGLYAKCTGNPSVPRWIGKAFVSATSPDSMARQDEKKLRSSSGLVLFTTDQDDQCAWIAAGQLFERFALTAQSLGIKTSFMNQPIEIPELRRQLQSTLNLGSEYPQLLARFGYAPDMPRSYRRPVAEVLIQ